MKMLGNHFSKESELFSVSYIYQKLIDKFSNLCPYGFNGSCKYVTEVLLHSVNQGACKLLELTPNTRPMDYALNCLSAADHMFYFIFPFISFYFLFFFLHQQTKMRSNSLPFHPHKCALTNDKKIVLSIFFTIPFHYLKRAL